MGFASESVGVAGKRIRCHARWGRTLQTLETEKETLGNLRCAWSSWEDPRAPIGVGDVFGLIIQLQWWTQVLTV